MPSSDETPKVERCILLLSDSWNCLQDGIASVNKSLATSLTRYKGVKVYSIIFTSDDLSSSDKQAADKSNVVLISLGNSSQKKDMYKKFNENPQEFCANLKTQIPFVSHIVGHSPVTADAALGLRNSLYPDSKVILFYHVIPRDVEWMSEKLPYTIPNDTDLVRLAEEADVVYSVTEKMHWYYTAKFRNRAKKEVDHRLYLPQSSEAVFGLRRKLGRDPRVLVVAEGPEVEDWQGLDIVACGVGKAVCAMSDGQTGGQAPSLLVSGVKQAEASKVRDDLLGFAPSSNMKLDVKAYNSPQDLYTDLSECSLCVVPSRAEPYGFVGLQALSAGIPTLIAEDSALASIIRRLTSEPEYFLVPVTPMTGAVRQDGSMWRDRIMAVLSDLDTAHERASQLRMALRRDEVTKESQDNVISYCLGGIRLTHELTELNFLSYKDEDKELPILRSFNKFLVATLKQCWRLKHHPLTQDGDLFQIIPGVDLPIQELCNNVTNHIEDQDRRIVGIDEKSGSFIVYCPTPDALSDLWAMCDRINAALYETLFTGLENQVLKKFRVRKVKCRTLIAGPEFLEYKRELTKTSQQ